MVYTTTDKEEILGSINKTSKGEVIVKRIEDVNGVLKSFDIRNYYYEDGQTIPTRKGVRIKAEDLAELLTLIMSGIHEEDDIFTDVSDILNIDEEM